MAQPLVVKVSIHTSRKKAQTCEEGPDRRVVRLQERDRSSPKESQISPTPELVFTKEETKPEEATV